MILVLTACGSSSKRVAQPQQHRMAAASHLDIACRFKETHPRVPELPSSISISFDCEAGLADDQHRGVGTGPFEPTLDFYATSVGCRVSIMSLGHSDIEKDPVSLAKDLDAALTTASLQ
jgi:hypothetical protein